MAVATTSFCSKDDVKKYLGFDSVISVTDDASLEIIIDGISVAIESYIGRDILSREYTEYYDGMGSKYLFPDHYPITSVSGIWEDADWEWGASTEIDSSDYRIKDNNHIVLTSDFFDKDDQNIKIIYTAGYASVPADLKLASIEEAARRFKRRKEIDVTAKSIGDGNVEITIDDFLPQTKVVLEKYRIGSIV